MEEFLKSISVAFYEFICCRIFLNVFLKQRFLPRLIGIVFTILLVGMAVITNLYGMYICQCIGSVFLIFLFSLVYYADSWQMKLFFSCFFCFLLYLIDYFSIVLSKLFFVRRVFNNDKLNNIIIALLCKSLLLIVGLFLKRIWKSKLQVKNFTWLLMSCFPLLSTVIMLFLLFERNVFMDSLIVCSEALVINIIILEWLKYISGKNMRWNRIKRLQERNEKRIRFCQEISIDNEEQRRILHDYHNQIGCIQGLLKVGDYQTAEVYVDKLAKLFSSKYENINVYNPIINVVLNQKYRLAKSKDISILFFANNLSDLWLEEQDIVSLLSNLLDNAIEACGKLENDKVIQIKLIREKKQFVFSIRNPASIPIFIENSQIHTEKKNKKWHGIGLKNVEMVIRKYEGIGLMRYEDGVFFYTVVIPEPECHSYKR